MATCALIFLATFSLEYLFFSDNFANAYVVAHSNRDLSTFYKVAALWSGQEGSLLFWSFLLAVYVLSVLINLPEQEWRVDAVRRGGDGRRADFLLTLITFVASPFKAAGVAGSGWSAEIT